MRTHVMPVNDSNRLGLDYRAEAGNFSRPVVDDVPRAIHDAHVHINSLAAAERFFEAADLYGISGVWSQTQLEEVDGLRERFGKRIEFVAVPNYSARDREDTFGTDWLRRLEGFASRGCRIAKFWSAPRGRDFHPTFSLDHPTRLEAMALARSLGMMFMTHVGDPDTWFATTYRDSRKYGTKAQQYEPLERLLERFHDVPWIAAHMGGDPEHLDHVQQLLDRHPNLCVDTSATKWMVRELSKHPNEFRDFCRRNPMRVFFGSDVVVDAKDDPATAFDLYASRYWSLRTLFETDYQGPSPIVDPDLSMVDPTLPKDSTARLCGAGFDSATLVDVYCRAAPVLLERHKQKIAKGGEKLSKQTG